MPLRPSIVWGIDPVAQSIASRFLSSQGIEDTQTGGLRLFEPGSEAARELRRTLALMREPGSAGILSGEPEVVIFASAFTAEAQATADLLRSTSEVLEAMLPGSQSIILVVFLPPPIATDEEKARTYEFFVKIEPLAGSLPFLNIIFVNQLSSALYADAAANDLLHEILICELLDEDLQSLIRGKGFASTRNPLKAGMRSCCYSTVGHLALVYQGSEALAYLRVRFGKAVFEDGFLNPAALTDSEEQLIRDRIRDLIAIQSQFWTGHIPNLGQVAADAFSRPLDPKSKAQAIVGLEQELERAVRSNAGRFEQDLNSQAARVKEELKKYLQGGVRLVAGARLFLDVLLRAETGIPLFEETFCRTPLQKRIDESLAPQFTATLAGADVNPPPPRKQDESVFDWLARGVASVQPAVQVTEPGPASPLRFFCASFDCLSRLLSYQTHTADRTREMLREVALEFAGESAALFEIAGSLRKEHDHVTKKLQQLPEQYTWLGRLATRRAEFRKERAGLQRELGEIANRLRDLERNFEATRKIFLIWVNQVVLPHLPRVRVKEQFQQQALEAAGEFQSLVESVGTQLTATMEHTPTGMDAEAAEESVLTEHRRELLYTALLGGKAMIHHARAALVFAGPAGDSTAEPSYQNCRTLLDHCEAGAVSLLDRIDDYTSALLAPMGEIDILEIIELEGKDAAERYLIERASQAARSLEFASGLMPLVAGTLHSTFTIKVRGGVESRLAAEYKSAFQPDRTFIDSGQPHRIEIVSQRFGFPAFLIQGMYEARRLARAETEVLWPEPKAEVNQAAEV